MRSAEQVQPGLPDQRRQPLHQLQRRRHKVRRAVAPRRHEPEVHLSGGVDLHPLIGQRRAQGAAAQWLQLLAVMHGELSSRLVGLEEKTGSLTMSQVVFSRFTRKPLRQVFDALREPMTPPGPHERAIGLVHPGR